ncbi:MAG: type II secretion system secretin GspD [Thermohalobaculum sp.]|nr:type II secretion system secretin GspD [Thermohalobaculum sp.]
MRVPSGAGVVLVLLAGMTLAGCEGTGRHNKFLDPLYGTEPAAEAVTPEPLPSETAPTGGTRLSPPGRTAPQPREVVRTSRRLPLDPAAEAQLARALGADAGPREPLERGIGGTARPVMLNFAAAPIGDFVDTVFGQALGANYYLDPAVQGRVTLQTSRELPPMALLEVAREILAANGADLLFRDGLYLIRPVTGDATRPARAIRIATLEHLGTDQLGGLLEPFLNAEVSVTALPGGSVLIAGTPGQAEAVLGLIQVFDIDPLAGRQLALLPLRTAPATQVADELTMLLTAPGTEGRFRIVPVERMNAVLVVAETAALLSEARIWARELDQGGGDDDGQVFVYDVQNRRAGELAAVLAALYASAGSTVTRTGKVAPGLAEVVLESEPGAGAGTAGGFATGGFDQPAPAARRTSDGATSVDLTIEGETVRVYADDGANSIVTRASPARYRTIEAALRQLDTVPMQVLIEATIAEVTLSDALEYGVRWFFESGDVQGSFSDSLAGLVAPTFPGFNLFLSTSNVRAVLSALDEVTDVEVVSTPSMMVLDNQTARLQVGDQVPVATQSAVDVTDPTAPIVNSIEFRDTGVILEVTPRVNASGLVVIDIRQEVSDVANTTSSTIDSPTIQQRAFSSTVAIESGQSIMLGGLIRDRRESGRAGIPLLSDIPILGALASTTAKEQDRTELIVILKPTVIRSTADAIAVTQEMQRKLTGIGGLGIGGL